MRSICQRLVDQANQLGGVDNITVITARFDGEALRASSVGDAFGYNTFPLAGTMHDEAGDPAPPSPEARSTFKSDPTPAFGTPIPARAVRHQEIEPAPTVGDHARLGAPELVVQERRQAVQPVFAVLGVIGLLAVLWFLFELFG